MDGSGMSVREDVHLGSDHYLFVTSLRVSYDGEAS